MVGNDAINSDKRYRRKNKVEEKVMRQVLDAVSLKRLGNNQVHGLIIAQNMRLELRRSLAVEDHHRVGSRSSGIGESI